MMAAAQTPTFEMLLTRSALVVLALGLAWSALVAGALVLEAVSQGRVRVARALGCPAWVHRWALGVLAAVLAATALVPSPASAARSPSPHALDGLPLPDRPVEVGPTADPSAGPRHSRPVPVSAVVRVQPGHSLWEISRARLPPEARPSRIAALTRSLHLRNRAVIGPDPDLIHPGQSLTVPPEPRTDLETYSEDS